MVEGLGGALGVLGAKSDDRRHDYATVIGQSLGGASGAALVAEG